MSIEFDEIECVQQISRSENYEDYTYNTDLLASYGNLYQQGSEWEKIIYENFDLKENKDIQILNVNTTTLYSPNQFIHTVKTLNNQNKPPLVILHGYWSSNCSFARLVKDLSSHYTIFCIDLPGQGLSSRDNFPFSRNNPPEQTINYFVDSIESWRQKLNLEKFTLIGHSFGGYMAGHYALQQPESLNKLILMSPAGIIEDENNEIQEGVVKSIMRSNGIVRKIFMGAFSALFDQELTVSGIYQYPITNLFPGRWLLRSYLRSFLEPNSVQYNQWFNYYDKIMRLPVSSEKCMTQLFKFPSFSAKNPLEKLLPKLKIPIHFIYGQNDWMERKCAQILVEEGKVNGTYHLIEKSGHTLQHDNPNKVIEKFLQLENF